jgi:hypothetical protein
VPAQRGLERRRNPVVVLDQQNPHLSLPVIDHVHVT